MKVVAGLIVFNGDEYLHYCLKSFYEVVDKIIIVEGCDPTYAFLATPQGLSLDDTKAIIQNFPDPYHKILHIEKGFMEKQNQLRDTILDFVDEDTDLYFTPDGDEVYDPKELLMAFKFMDDFREIHRLLFNHVFFRGDFRHIQYGPDTYFIIRVYRYFKDMRVTLHHTIPLKEGYKEIGLNFVNTYHLGWVRPRKRLLDKVLWTVKRHLYYNTGSYLILKGKSDSEIIEWIISEELDILYPKTSEPKKGIYEYTGKYPEALIEYMADRVYKENKK
jgi:hypothetical protein